MDHGRLAQVAAPSEIYERPNSRWVADFIGEVTLIEGMLADGAMVETGLGRFHAAIPSSGKKRDTIWLALRPEKLRIGAQRPTGGELNAVAGTVFEIGYRGDMSIYKVRLADRSLMKVALANTSASGQASFGINDLVWLSWPPEAGWVLTR
jgi:putrescine transport system ATP-binding protein